MGQVRFSEEVSIYVDINDIWERMNDEEKAEWLEEEGLMRINQREANKWQDFAYNLTEEEAKELKDWLLFYKKI